MTTAKTFGDLIWAGAARRSAWVRDALLVVGGSLFVAVCARFQFPSAPIPFTLQAFAVLLVGAALGPRRGSIALVVYLLEGLGGLPVFSMPPYAGAAYFAGPTAGYLFSFPLAAGLVGWLAHRGWDRGVFRALAALTMGQALILGLGFAWMAPTLGAKSAFDVGIAPFLVGDVLKIVVAAAALPMAWRIVALFDGPDRA